MKKMLLPYITIMSPDSANPGANGLGGRVGGAGDDRRPFGQAAQSRPFPR